MRFVPKSHLSGLSSHQRVPSATNPRLLVAHPDDSSVVHAPVQAGGMVVHNVLTLHSTGPNEGAQTRRVWILNFGVGPRHDSAISRTLRSARVRAGLALRR
jgi:ectoine hydroxylase-related dioxygenase (phytanoyl-CoA dioxygenase family)